MNAECLNEPSVSGDRLWITGGCPSASVQLKLQFEPFHFSGSGLVAPDELVEPPTAQQSFAAAPEG